MDICIATDNNYISLVSVLISSILNNKRNNTDVIIHLFEYNVDEEEQKELVSFCKRYDTEILFYDIQQYIDAVKNQVDNAWANNNSYVAYARLYMSDLLNENIKKFIYLDCDTLVLDDLSSMMNIDMRDCVMAEVKDVLPYTFKKWMGFEDGNYFNSGVSVINADLWRKGNYTTKFFAYCNNNQDDLFPDQDAINILLKNKIYALPPKYCVFFPEFEWSSNIMLKGYLGPESTYYSSEELQEAANNPSIIHFTDSVIGRPWQNNHINKHALLWNQYYNMLPDSLHFTFSKKSIGWKTKIYRLLYKVLSGAAFSRIYYTRRNYDLDERMREHNR